VTGARVTALMPVREYLPHYLREAAGSLLAQTSPRWHAVVIHPRGLGDQLERDLGEAASDPRIELVAERGRKLAGAINTGMRAAQTEFVASLFADDRWDPTAVEVLERRIVERSDVDFFHSARRDIDDDGELVGGVMPARADVRLETFSRTAPVKHLLCWRRELALAIGGIDESLNSVGPDDYDFPWSMAEAGARFGAISECLYLYRDHRSCYRLSTHLPLRTHLRETRRILRKHGVPRDQIRARLAAARSSYLQQCLYSSRLDAWLKRALRRDDPADGWRESYERSS
jgi:glycosyltransferase involved in cell wall biosynthesis